MVMRFVFFYFVFFSVAPACALDVSVLLQVKVQVVTSRSTGSKESKSSAGAAWKSMMSPAVEPPNLPRRKELFSTFKLLHRRPPSRPLHISDMRRAVVLDGGPAKYAT